MAGRVYHSEEHYRIAVKRANSQREAISRVAAQLGTALIAASAARWFTIASDIHTIFWFIAGAGLIYGALFVLRFLQAESI
jgi:hypothetical protein